MNWERTASVALLTGAGFDGMREAAVNDTLAGLQE